VLIERPELPVRGKEMRVELRLSSAAEILLLRELSRRLVREVVADDARRKRRKTSLLEGGDEALAGAYRLSEGDAVAEWWNGDKRSSSACA